MISGLALVFKVQTKESSIALSSEMLFSLGLWDNASGTTFIHPGLWFSWKLVQIPVIASDMWLNMHLGQV